MVSGRMWRSAWMRVKMSPRSEKSGMVVAVLLIMSGRIVLRGGSMAFELTAQPNFYSQAFDESNLCSNSTTFVVILLLAFHSFPPCPFHALGIHSSTSANSSAGFSNACLASTVSYCLKRAANDLILQRNGHPADAVNTTPSS